VPRFFLLQILDRRPWASRADAVKVRSPSKAVILLGHSRFLSFISELRPTGRMASTTPSDQCYAQPTSSGGTGLKSSFLLRLGKWILQLAHITGPTRTENACHEGSGLMHRGTLHYRKQGSATFSEVFAILLLQCIFIRPIGSSIFWVQSRVCQFLCSPVRRNIEKL
jgi:hypothetical protein